ncbi:MAG: anthranilate phosphoribosyltransferase [Polyangiales bacterium]|nr:anthranilate phosphoribosyltransferase [Myxococcales bacterium]MCB9659177.1 anthranilate phosphoribosyltransferase [Sandaracinaceae bacterium]
MSGDTPTLRDTIMQVVARQDLDGPTMEHAMEEVLAGRASPVQIAALAVGLRMKGETTEEIAAAARVMRRRCIVSELDPGGPVLDTCGTGGDGLDTFNISTVSAIVAAAAGVRVAKHGNRAASSRAGSADVLEALGVAIDLDAQQVSRCVREVGLGFLFARQRHAALRHAAPVRQELGVRTFFNLLGPLTNPAGATHQVVGVYDGARVRQLAEVLGQLGSTAAWVVHGHGGIDELSTSGPTQVAELRDGVVREWVVTPEEFGLERAPLEALVGGDPAENANIARAVLAGERGPRRTAVLLNAGAALCVAGRAATPREAADHAASVIDSGRAAAKLEEWAALTQALRGDG